MKVRKRYIFLTLVALLPLLKFIHLEDAYCFGDKDLLVIAFLAILFTIPFLVVLFFNLYKISILKELFNYTPIIIAVLYYSLLVFFINNHDKNFLKDVKLAYEYRVDNDTRSQLTLYLSGDYQLKSEVFAQNCYQEGKFDIKNDTLYLKKGDFPDFMKNFDSSYFIDKEGFRLIPVQVSAHELKQIKKNNFYSQK